MTKCTAREPSAAGARGGGNNVRVPAALPPGPDRGHDSVQSQQTLKWQENGEAVARSPRGRKNSENTSGLLAGEARGADADPAAPCPVSPFASSLD